MECKWCGESLAGMQARAKYCCSECASNWHNAIKRGLNAPTPTTYPPQAFDGLVASWMQATAYPVGKLFGSVRA